MERYLSTLTSKGQTTIPNQVRKHLNLDTGDEIEFELINNDSSGKEVIVRHVGLFRNIRDILREVLRMSKEYGDIGKKERRSIINLADFIEEDDSVRQNYRTQFNAYLNFLDFEVVKVIQIIMYLGRDEDYNRDDSVADIYRNYREDFDKKGWSTQEIEISQMLSKSPRLYGYFLNGYKILKIE